jgi:pimeloyl-ACP methyl ester carboxylesterase
VHDRNVTFLELTRAVIAPGTGSDEMFVRGAFERPLTTLGMRLHAPPPVPGHGLVDGFMREFDNTAAEGRSIVVGGVSLGAHLAARWAARNPHRCAGLIAVMPGWLGAPGDAPAVRAARIGADTVRSRGLDAALAAAVDGVAPWLAAELRRSWPRYGDDLAASLDLAADSEAPDVETLARLDIPAVVVGCTEDPVHPAEVAGRWARSLPRSAHREVAFDTLSADREALGRAVVDGWRALQ